MIHRGYCFGRAPSVECAPAQGGCDDQAASCSVASPGALQRRTGSKSRLIPRGSEGTWLTVIPIDDPAKNSKRMAAFALVVIIHVLFVYVLASGLGKKVVEVVMDPSRPA